MRDNLEDLVQRAQEFARRVHKRQKDDDGKPYFTAHVKPVAKLISMVTKDAEIIAAAYLHDTVEDHKVTPEQLAEQFGQRVAGLVMEVTHVGEEDNYRYPLLKSRDGIMLKLADRLNNISRMGSWSEEKKRKYLASSVFWKS